MFSYDIARKQIPQHKINHRSSRRRFKEKSDQNLQTRLKHKDL